MTTPDSLEDARFIRNPVPLASYFHQRHKAARERLLSVVAPPLAPRALPAPRETALRELPPITTAQFAEAHRILERDIDPFLAAALSFGRANKVRLIQETVARHFEISLLELLSESRVGRVAFPRQVAMFLSRAMTQKSLPEIARRFGGKDHTTVLHAVRKIGAMIDADPAFSERVEMIRFEIETRCSVAPETMDNSQLALATG